MSDERIRRARQAELEALVDEHGTEGEKFSLDLSGVCRAGVTLTRLHAAANGDETVRFAPPDPKLLAATVSRIELRRRLSLEHVDCTSGGSACVCLRDALDELGEGAARAKVLRRARKLHAERTGPFRVLRKLRPKPRPAAPVSPIGPPTAPAPIPAAVVTETSTRPFRRVRRSPKWWDGPGGRPPDIRDMQF